MHPSDSDHHHSQDDSRMFDATEQSPVNPLDQAASAPENDANAIQLRINQLTGQLAELTQQLEALKSGSTEATDVDPFSCDVADFDPFASGNVEATADRPCRDELNQLFSKIKSAPNATNEEELLDPAGPVNDQSSDFKSDCDEELVEPDVAPSASSAPPREPESVAEVLARMKASGQLESDLDFDVGKTQNEPSASQVPATPAEEPGVAETAVSQTPQQMAPTDANSLPESDEASEDDVQSYMSQLLNRLNGGTASVPEPESKKTNSAKAGNETGDAKHTPKAQDHSLLEPEEFIPSKVAPEKNANLAAMREIALESTRSAVSSSIERRRKAKIMISLSASLASFSAAGFTAMLSSRIGDAASMSSATLVVVGLGLAFMFVKALFGKLE